MKLSSRNLNFPVCCFLFMYMMGRLAGHSVCCHCKKSCSLRQTFDAVSAHWGIFLSGYESDFYNPDKGVGSWSPTSVFVLDQFPVGGRACTVV